MDFYSWPNRTLCDTLEEMRKLLANIDHQSVPMMKSLVEEAQTLGNRMEAGLEDWSDTRRARDKLNELKDEIKELKAEKQKLTKKVKK